MDANSSQGVDDQMAKWQSSGWSVPWRWKVILQHGLNNLYTTVQENEHVANKATVNPKKVLIESLLMPLPIGISLAEGPRSNSAGVQCGPRVSSPNQMESSVTEESSELPDETMMFETKPPVGYLWRNPTSCPKKYFSSFSMVTWVLSYCHTQKVSPKLLGGWFGGLNK